MTAVLEAATPTDDIWISAESIEEVIALIDERFKTLMSVQLNGDYVKFDHAADVILDVRQGLKSLISIN